MSVDMEPRRIADLAVDDVIDLQGDPYTSPPAISEFEYAQVVEIQDGPDGGRVIDTDQGCFWAPVDHQVQAKKRT